MAVKTAQNKMKSARQEPISGLSVLEPGISWRRSMKPGGANELALRAASIIGAEPVITTATDRNGLLAPDVFAKENGLENRGYGSGQGSGGGPSERRTPGLFFLIFQWRGQYRRSWLSVRPAA